MQNRRDQWSAAAITAGLAYLVWRAAATLGGVPLWLSVPALVVEVLGWMALTVVLAVVRRRPAGATTAPPRRGDLADVIIRVDGQPVPHVLATLAGVRHADGVVSTTIAVFAPRPEIVSMGDDYGVRVVQVSRDTDAAGLRTALSIGTAPFIAVLDAGDVPTPEFIGVLVRSADDGYVAAVVGRLECRSTDSAEHDLTGRHVRRFEREVLVPSTGPAATIQGSGTLLRRWAVDHVGVPSGSRRGIEMRLSGRLRLAGLQVVAPAAPVVVWERAANTAVAARSIRRRETAGALEWLRSKDGPLFAKGLSWRDRFAFCSTTVRPLAGIRRAAFLVVLIASLLVGRLPLTASLLGLAAVWLPYVVLRLLAWRSVSAGSSAFGDAARWSFSTMGASVSGLFGPGNDLIGADVASPRLGGRAALSANRALTMSLLALALIVPLVAVSDRFTGWLPTMAAQDRALLLTATIWSIVLMLDVLRCLTGSSQLRRSTRVPLAEPGRVDDFPAVFVDLTPYGAGVLVDGIGSAEPVLPGDEVTFLFDVAKLSGRRARVTGTAVVRSARHSLQGYLCGLEFTGMDFMSSDAIYEFCEVMHAAQASPTARTATAPGGPAPTRPTAQTTSGPRRLAVRLSAVVVLLGVGLATAPTGRSIASDGASGVALPTDPVEQGFVVGVFVVAMATIAAVVGATLRPRVRRGSTGR
jgi:cellulose synthase/poly-beta-1,6-N-acetylglucosamine synthase-like glycosyltransferase